MSKRVSNKRYSGEFKQKVIGHMAKNNLSYNETQKLLEIAGQTQKVKTAPITSYPSKIMSKDQNMLNKILYKPKYLSI